MKNATIKRTVSVCMSLLMLFLLNVSAFAAEPETTAEPRYAIFSLCSADLDITRTVLGGKASCSALAATTKSGYSTQVTAELQKLDGTWKHVTSWTASGSYEAEVDEIHYVASGNTYRVKATAKVYDANGVLRETATTYSEEVNY